MNPMDFDTILSDIGLTDRSDIFGGIDNEALDLGQFLENSNANALLANAATAPQQLTSTNIKSELLRPNLSAAQALTNPKCHADNNNSLGITTISAHVSVTTSTPISTPITGSSVTLNISQNGAHLPESPPDSGSEPPYSPLQIQHGLTLTSRDTYTTSGGGDVGSGGNEMASSGVAATAVGSGTASQFTIPSPSHHINPNQMHHEHQQQYGGHLNDGIRVKHEAGLIMNPNNLVTHAQNHLQLYQHQHSQQQHNQHLYSTNNNSSGSSSSNHNLGVLQSHHGHASDTHIDMSGTGAQHSNASNVQMIYANAGNIINYDPPPYPGIYPQLNENLINNIAHNSVLTEMPRVEFIGTERPRPSAPSTPVHNTRKRKMSTQLDYIEASSIKLDPALKSSPLHNLEMNKHHADLMGTPAHSNSNSHSPALSHLMHENSMDTPSNSGSNNNDPNDPNGLSRCITFSSFQPQQWHKLLDQNLQELSVLFYQIDADKGFNFSISDDAFVCQKKNHFQITCHAKLQAEAKFVNTPSGLEKIKAFHVHFYGVKFDAPNQTIRVEQSQSDRSKKPFHPVPIDLQSHIESKITVGRLHFSETTNNNMRKKGRPNPDQRYFQLVVALHVHTASGNYPIISQASERIIVRASNPGQFESDVELCWQKGFTQDTIFHAGRVGINTDRPDESLVVHGNLRISGHIVQPSDSRVKQEIGKMDTSEQLRNVLKIRIVKYRYEPEFAIHSGLRKPNNLQNDKVDDIGVIAQEVREVIPDAVHEAGSVVLSNGNVIENLLLVNKDRILMENIGATQELGKVTESLDNRVVHLERGCVILVVIMAICLLAVSTLYFVEHNKQKNHLKHLEELQMNHFYSVYSMQFHDKDHQPSLTNHNKTTHLPWQSPPWLNRSVDLVPPNAETKDTPKVDYKKPYVSHQNLQKHQHEITTTAPILRANKASNKSKPKIATVHQNTHKLIINGSLKQRLDTNISQRIPAAEASGEKIVDSVSVTQGFENNSIDIEAQQQVTKKPLTAPKNTIDNNHLLGSLAIQNSPDDDAIAEDLGHQLNEHPALNDGPSNDSFKHTEQITIPSIAHSNGYGLTSTTTISQLDTYTLKALAPLREIVLTVGNKQYLDNYQSNYSLVPPPTSNNSKGVFDNTLDNQEPAEFHDLNHQNISTDHTQFEKVYKYVSKSALERRSASTESSITWTILPATYEDVFGEPEDCVRHTNARLTNCVSACHPDDLKIKPLSLEIVHDLHEPKEPLDQVNQQNIDTESNFKSQEDLDDEIVENKAKLKLPFEIGKNSHATQSVTKQIAEEQPSEDNENLDLHERENIEEPLNEKKILTKLPESDAVPVLISDCSRLTGQLVAYSANRTYELDDICAYDEKLLQKSYIMPISPFLSSETIELHLSSSKPLNWFLCDSKVKDASKKPAIVDNALHKDIDEFLQQTRAHFTVTLPKQGSFEQQLFVRITNETKTGNICSETPLATNTILQYNFKLLRNCD